MVCRRREYTRPEKRRLPSKSPTLLKSNEAHADAFEHICQYIEETIIADQKVERLSMIRERYLKYVMEHHPEDYCGRPWPAAYINIIQNTHQIQVLTEALFRAQAIFHSLPNNEWGTKYRGLTYSAK